MEQLYLKKCNCGNFELEHYFNTKTNEIIYINKNSDKLEKVCKSNRCNYFFNNNLDDLYISEILKNTEITIKLFEEIANKYL